MKLDFTDIFTIIMMLVFLFLGIFAWINSYGYDDVSKDYDMKDYSCEQLEKMLIAEIYPREEVNREVFFNGRWASSNRSYYFHIIDYRNTYRDKCFNVESKPNHPLEWNDGEGLEYAKEQQGEGQ